jgi:hypothetical protein
MENEQEEVTIFTVVLAQAIVHFHSMTNNQCFKSLQPESFPTTDELEPGHTQPWMLLRLLMIQRAFSMLWNETWHQYASILVRHNRCTSTHCCCLRFHVTWCASLSQVFRRIISQKATCASLHAYTSKICICVYICVRMHVYMHVCIHV